MSTTTSQNIPTSSAYQEKISIVLVSPHKDDHAQLRNILHHNGWQISFCSTVKEASARLRSTPQAMVICERDLSDGTWKDVLKSADESPAMPAVVVFSRHADENLWGEVLNLGGYDVLIKPFDRSEVTRVVGMARLRYIHPAAAGLTTQAH